MADQELTPEERGAQFLERLARLCDAHEVRIEASTGATIAVWAAGELEPLTTFTEAPHGR